MSPARLLTSLSGLWAIKADAQARDSALAEGAQAEQERILALAGAVLGESALAQL